MGVYRVDGGRGLSPSAAPSQSSVSRPATFAQAVQNARTATDKAVTSNDPQLMSIAQANWAIVQDWEENDYRIAATSADPKAAMNALDVKYGGLIQDNGSQQKILDQITAGAREAVQAETPAERQYQLDLYGRKTKIAETYDALQSAAPEDRDAAFTNYTAAVKEVINFQLTHQLAKLPAGPNGSHTLAQWQQAADAIKALPETNAESAQLIDTIAKVSGYVDQIQNNRAALKLTPAEQDLANTNPVTLAFVKAAGLAINLDDPKVSPEMKQIAQKDPVLFVMLSLGGASISTSSTPVAKDSNVGQLANGQYLHITIGGKAIVDQKLLSQLVQLHANVDEENRPLAMANALVPALHPEQNVALQSLMLASDNARTHYGEAQIKALTSGGTPDEKALLSFFTTQLTGYFDSGARKTFWESHGKPYFTQDYFRTQFEQRLTKPDPRTAQNDPGSTETNADKIGRYMQDVLKNAPREIADVMLDTLKTTYRADWEWSYKSDMSGGTSRYEDFYKGLTMAVELSPQRAQEIADWLLARSAPQSAALIVLWDSDNRQFEGLKNTIVEGYGPTLSHTLLESVKKSPEHQGMVHNLELRFNQGWDAVQGKYIDEINKQNYDEIMDDVDKYLQPFFQSFLSDKNIGNPVAMPNETQLHNMIGKTLGLVPTDTEAAAALDYTKEWYAPDTADWNTILLVTQMIDNQLVELTKEHGKRDYTINALPGKYLSERDGAQTRGLFLISMPGTDAQEVIDPQAAADAVAINGGQKVETGDVSGRWHFDSLKHFQDDNLYDDDGFLYLPTNLRLGDSDNDGKISPSDYHQHAAAITTTGEHAQTIGLTALAVAGVGLMFVPGANVVVAGILVSAGVLGAGVSGVALYKMKETGANIGWGNTEARMHWMNIAGNALAFGRLGILKLPRKLPRTQELTASLMGGTATYIGVTQMAAQTQHVAQNWDEKGFGLLDKVVGVAGIASGATMISLSGMGVNPAKAVNNPVKEYGGLRVASARQTGAFAFKEWLASKSPSGGVVAALWSKSHATFQASIGKPAYDAWVAAQRPVEAWWTGAVNKLQPRIDAEVQRQAGSGNTPSAALKTQVEKSFADEIGVEAFNLWAVNKPKNATAYALWSKADKQFQKATGWSAYQLWRAEQGFIKQIGEGGYNAYLASVKAKIAPAPWWTDAISGFRTKIDAQAQIIAGRGTVTPAHTAKAELSFARDIGVEAYRLWNTTYANQRPLPTTTSTGKQVQPHFTYKGWVKAGNPQRVTTKTDDVVFWQGEQGMFFRPLKIGRLTLWRNPRMLQQAATDVTVWSGAQKTFQIRIGKATYSSWLTTLNKSVGSEDVYFKAANDHYIGQIAAKAHGYFESPNQLLGRNVPRINKGATAEFWSTNRAEFEAQIKSAASDWVNAKMPVKLRHWDKAVADMQPQIQARAHDLLQNAPLTTPPATKAQFIPEAQKFYSYEIAAKAFTYWTGTRSASAKYAAQFKQADDKMTQSRGAPAYDLWAKAGFPDGRKNAPWVAARRDVVDSGFRGERLGQWGKDLFYQSRIKATDRGGAVNGVGWKQGWLQMTNTITSTGKVYAIGYVATNAVGAGLWYLTNKVVTEHRTTGSITDPENELRTLLDDPDDYVENNYENRLGIFGLSDWGHQADGHMMAFITPEGEIEYFHRIPDDLYEALKATAKPDTKPWVLGTQSNQQAQTTVFEKDGRLYVYETIKLDQSGTYPYSEADLLNHDPALLPNEIKEQIGVRAYQEWVDGNRLTGTAASTLWTQAETEFHIQTDQKAYDAWVAAKRPKAGDDKVWQQALAGFQPQIDADIAKAHGNAPTQTQKDAIEATFGPRIASNAYGLWRNDTRKPATQSAAIWTAAEPAFQAKLGLPAFEAWVKADRLTNGDNLSWGQAIKGWDDDGKPILQQVEIRPPYRTQENPDVPDPHSTNLNGSGGRRDRFNWGWGPIEGWRIHANLELLGNYRYNIPTTTTFRIGGPSPTQGWSWDVRQQDTTMWSRVNLSVGTIEYNGAQVYDLTEDSRDGWAVMNSRLYTDIGNRNRLRVDVTGRYLRFRETGFVEIGLGADFFKRTTADNTLNVNGYYELQLYAPDFRAQINTNGNPDKAKISNTRGFEAFPLLGIDPAFQISWTDNRLRLVNLPILSSKPG